MKADDPLGHYAALGVRPGASPAEIKAAFRRRVRELHPDVPASGDPEAFRRLVAAYKVLSDPGRRSAYDRSAAVPASSASFKTFPGPIRVEGRLFRSGVAVAIGGFALMACCVGALMATNHRSEPPTPAQEKLGTFSGPSANLQEQSAATALPAPSVPASALAGPPNNYVVPGDGPAILWRGEPDTGSLVRIGVLRSFTPVRATGAAKDGLQPVALKGGSIGYIDAARLMAGDAREAERARCTYFAGVPPANGEVLASGKPGTERATIDNRGPISAVISLRGRDGQLAVRAFLAANGTSTLTSISGAPWTEQAEFGELWSRACSRFVSGYRLQQAAGLIQSGAYVPIEPDTANH